MRSQRARRGRGGGEEGAQASIAQLLRLLNGGSGPDRDPLILRKAQVALNWARPQQGENNVQWLLGYLPAGYHGDVLRALGHAPAESPADEEAAVEPEIPARTASRGQRRRSRHAR